MAPTLERPKPRARQGTPHDAHPRGRSKARAREDSPNDAHPRGRPKPRVREEPPPDAHPWGRPKALVQLEGAATTRSIPRTFARLAELATQQEEPLRRNCGQRAPTPNGSVYCHSVPNAWLSNLRERTKKRTKKRTIAALSLATSARANITTRANTH